MKKEEAIEKGLSLVNRSNIAMLGTIGAEGHPNVRAMIKIESEGLKRIWFTTNTSSRKIPQLQKNPKACVYFVDFDQWMGVMLVGSIAILQDHESRKRCWREGFEKYYPKGIDDPDYSVLHFTAHWGQYYHGLTITNLDL